MSIIDMRIAEQGWGGGCVMVNEGESKLVSVFRDWDMGGIRVG